MNIQTLTTTVTEGVNDWLDECDDTLFTDEWTFGIAWAMASDTELFDKIFDGIGMPARYLTTAKLDWIHGRLMEWSGEELRKMTKADVENFMASIEMDAELMENLHALVEECQENDTEREEEA